VWRLTEGAGIENSGAESVEGTPGKSERDAATDGARLGVSRSTVRRIAENGV